MTKRKTAKRKTALVMGRVLPLSDGRKVGLYMLDGGLFGWRFVSAKGDVTQIVLSQEAMNAVLQLHNETTWQPWTVTGPSDQPAGEP